LVCPGGRPWALILRSCRFSSDGHASQDATLEHVCARRGAMPSIFMLSMCARQRGQPTPCLLLVPRCTKFCTTGGGGLGNLGKNVCQFVTPPTGQKNLAEWLLGGVTLHRRPGRKPCFRKHLGMACRHKSPPKYRSPENLCSARRIIRRRYRPMQLQRFQEVAPWRRTFSAGFFCRILVAAPPRWDVAGWRGDFCRLKVWARERSASYRVAWFALVRGG
jgi:hypothetical protein